MTKVQALQVLEEVEAVCRKHGLYTTVERQNMPDLKWIVIKDIKIKITEAEK